MTPEQLRKIDALVAEHVMGWTKVKEYEKGYLTGSGSEAYYDFDREWKSYREHGGYCEGRYRCLPRYSTDISVAWEVVEKLDTGDFNIQFDAASRTWVAYFTDSDFSKIYLGENTTAPLTICQAALNFVGGLE